MGEIQPRYCFFYERVIYPSFFFTCVVGIPQMLEGLLANDMFHTTGLKFRQFRRNPRFHEPLGEETMLFINPFSKFQPLFRQGKCAIGFLAFAVA